MIVSPSTSWLRGDFFIGYIAGTNRSEVLLFPAALDHYITAENSVRFIAAFVASLDLSQLGFTRAVPAQTARPA
jgi:hypothetical protein